MKVFLNIGREIPDTKGLSKADIENLVKDSLLKLAVVTMSQLGSHSLYHEASKGNDALTKESWAKELATIVQKVETAGFIVDRALREERGFCHHFNDFIRYCLRKGLIASESSGKLRLNKGKILDNSHPGYSQNPAYYCHNEFSSLLGLGYQSSLIT